MGSNLRKWQLPALISLGMSFFWLLLRRGHIALFFAPVETGAGLPGPYLAAVVLALAVALADALAQGFFSRIVVRHAWILVFVDGISAVLGLVAGILGSESPPAVALGKAVCYAALLCGLAWGWGTLVSERLSRRVIVSVAISFALATLVSLVDLSPEPFCFVLPFAGPLVSSLALWKAADMLSASDKPSADEAVLHEKGRFMALVIAYLLVGGLVRGMSYAEGASSTPSVGGSLSVTLASFGCAAVVVAIFIATRNDELALNLLWAVVSLLYFMGLFGMVSASGFLGSGLFVAARTCFTLLLFLSLADLAASKGQPSRYMLLFIATETLSSAVTYVFVPWVAAVFPSLFQVARESMLLMAALALIGLTLIVLTYEKYYSQLKKQGKGGQQSLLLDPQAALDELSCTYLLTQREREVCALLYKGNNYKKIAEVLVISPQTVLSHTRNIYAKLNVHSKQELIDLVNCRIGE